MLTNFDDLTQFSRLSTINSYGYRFADIHDFSGYRRQEIQDKNMEVLLWYTALCCICLGRFCFGLETRVIIKISKNPCYPTNFDLFSWEWSIFLVFWKKSWKWPTKKKLIFQLGQFSIFFVKISWIGLWLVELIDAKGIGVAQPIWLWGCST